MDWEKYVNVNDRIVQFRKEVPEGRIVTEVVSDAVDLQGNRLVQFRCSIYLNREDQKDNLPASTGHSEALVDAEKVLEKGETVSIGRALASLGFNVDYKIASQEEMENWNHRQSSFSNQQNQSVELVKEDQPLTATQRIAQRRRNMQVSNQNQSDFEEQPHNDGGGYQEVQSNYQEEEPPKPKKKVIVWGENKRTGTNQQQSRDVRDLPFKR